MLQGFRWLRANRPNLSAIYGENSADFYRAVFLSNLGRLFAAMLVVVHVAVAFPGTSFLDDTTKLRLIPGIAIIVGLLICAAWLVEHGRHAVARYLTNLTISASTMLSVVMCGGFLNSHATPFLIAPIVVAFCISPPKEAKIVGCLTFFFPLIFDIFLRWIGWEISDYTSISSPTANTIFLLTTLFITVFISLVFLQRTNHELHLALDRDNKKLHQWATVDPLTELGNRRAFDSWLGAAQSAAISTNDKFALIFMDLNAFKPVNDRFGHDVGDEVLKVIAERLARTLEGYGNVARLGGDEFAFLPNGPYCETVMNSFISAIDLVVREPISIGGNSHQVSSSFGTAVFPDDADNSSDLLRVADMDMYACKLTDRLTGVSKLRTNGKSIGQRAA